MNRVGMGCLLLLLFGVLYVVADDVVDTTVCDVLADPASFNGKMVRVKAATVVAGFDEFIVDGSGCNPAAAIWLAYPEGAKGKAGPAAFLQLQLAKNGAAVTAVPKATAVTLQRNGDFNRFDSLLATPYKSSSCLGCSRHTVTATLVGRLDGVNVAGVLRDESGKVTGLAGFGNLNSYRARLVLQTVSEVMPREINYSGAAAAVKGDLRRVGERATPDGLQRAIAAFGREGEDNGVIVSFGVVNEVPLNEGVKGDQASPDGMLFHATFDMERLEKQKLQKAMAHVGTHIADIRAGVRQALEQAEARAWQSANY